MIKQVIKISAERDNFDERCKNMTRAGVREFLISLKKCFSIKFLIFFEDKSFLRRIRNICCRQKTR